MLAAARRRLAAEGPGASLRDIAADADVNLGLLHRHFGTKDDLIRAVFLANAEAGLAIVEDADDVRRRVRPPARQLPDRRADLPADARVDAAERPHPHASSSPTSRPSNASSRSAPANTPARRCDPRPWLLLALLAMYGWQVFADQLLVALGYDAADKPAVLDELVQLLSRRHADRVRSSKPES